MKIDTKHERAFLEWIAEECAESDAPNRGAVYDPISPASPVESHNGQSSHDAALGMRIFKTVKNLALDRGWILEDPNVPVLRLTDGGYSRLEWHEQSEVGPKFYRGARSVFGAIVLNVVVPVLVAYLTAHFVGGP